MPQLTKNVNTRPVVEKNNQNNVTIIWINWKNPTITYSKYTKRNIFPSIVVEFPTPTNTKNNSNKINILSLLILLKLMNNSFQIRHWLMDYH